MKLSTLVIALPLLSLTAGALPARAAKVAKNDPGQQGGTPATSGAPDAGRPADKSAAPPAGGGNSAGGAREPAPPVAPTIDLAKLRAEYDRLRDELFRARSRSQLVEDALWKSKLSASFRWKGGPSYLVHHASVRLDGGEIWDSGDKPVTDNLITVAERAVKAGPHAITLRIEIRPGKKAKDSDRLGYVSEHTFAIIVPDGKRTRVEITGDEDGDAPEYEPEIEVEVESEK